VLIVRDQHAAVSFFAHLWFHSIVEWRHPFAVRN
jgi:hypothetical protein